MLTDMLYYCQVQFNTGVTRDLVMSGDATVSGLHLHGLLEEDEYAVWNEWATTVGDHTINDL